MGQNSTSLRRTVMGQKNLSEVDMRFADVVAFAPSLVQFGALIASAQNYALSVMQCVGPSMLPTLGISGDVVLMWPTASGLIQPQLGDVVICASPTDPTSTVCKRITGLHDDFVHLATRIDGVTDGHPAAHLRARHCVRRVLAAKSFAPLVPVGVLHARTFLLLVLPAFCSLVLPLCIFVPAF